MRKTAMVILLECLRRETTPAEVALAACVAIVPLLRDESQVRTSARVGVEERGGIRGHVRARRRQVQKL